MCGLDGAPARLSSARRPSNALSAGGMGTCRDNVPGPIGRPCVVDVGSLGMPLPNAIMKSDAWFAIWPATEMGVLDAPNIERL